MTSGVNGGMSWGEKEGERDKERELCETTGLVQETEGKIRVTSLPQGTKAGWKSRAHVGQNMMTTPYSIISNGEGVSPCFLVGMWSS